MNEFMLIFVLQFFFQLTRTLGTRYVAKDNIAGSVILSFFIQALWLTTTFLGVKFMAEMDWMGITGYMLGGLLGVYISMKIRINDSYTPQIRFYKNSVFKAIAEMDYSSCADEYKNDVTIIPYKEKEDE